MEKQNPQSSGVASTFVKCLGCTKLVRLPAEPDPNAMARCPRCGETYQIGELLDAEIPELEVFGSAPQSSSTGPAIVSFEPKNENEPVETVPKDEFNRFVVAPALAKGAKRKKHRRSRSSSESKSSGAIKPNLKQSDRSERRSSSGSSRSSSRSSSSRRTSQKADSRFGEVVKIIFGAMMAPPVAQLVIWWVLGLDPLGLGPATSKFVPPLVPAKFHAEKNEEPKAEVESKIDESDGASADDEFFDEGPSIKEELPPAPRDIDSFIID